MAEIENLTVRLTADLRQFNRSVKESMTGVTTQATRGAQALGQTKNRAVDLQKVGGAALRRFAGIAAGVFAVSKIAQYAEQYVNLQNQIKTVIGPTESLAEKTQTLLELSRETRSSLDATATLYARLRRNTQDLDLTEAELLETVETVNKSFAISGASAQEAAGAIRQLSQGLASGVLRGDEFNSVAEQAPVILEAVAAATGRSRGELRELAAEGAITSDVLIESLQRYSSVIDEDFAKSQRTASQGAQALQDQFTLLAGELDNALGITTSTSDAFLTLAKGLASSKGPLLGIIEDTKVLADLLKDELAQSFDEVELGEFQREFEAFGEVLDFTLFVVKTSVASIARIIQSGIETVATGVANLLDVPRVGILELRKIISEFLGDDDQAAIIEAQIASIKEGVTNRTRDLAESVSENIKSIATDVADFESAIAKKRLERRQAEAEEEIRIAREAAEKRKEIEAGLAEEGFVSLAAPDEDDLNEPSSRKEIEKLEAKKKLLEEKRAQADEDIALVEETLARERELQEQAANEEREADIKELERKREELEQMRELADERIEILRNELEREKELREEFGKEGGDLEDLGFGEKDEKDVDASDIELLGDDPLIEKIEKRNKTAEDSRKDTLNNLLGLSRNFVQQDAALGQQALQFTTQKASSSILAYAAEGAEKAIAQLGPAGIPVAGLILAAGSALSSKISNLGIGQSGGFGGGDIPGGGAAPIAPPSINTAPVQPEVTASLQESGGTVNGQSSLRFTADSGDELEELLAAIVNKGIRDGRIRAEG